MKTFYISASGEKVIIKSMPDKYLFNAYEKYKKKLQQFNELLVGQEVPLKIKIFYDDLVETVKSLGEEVKVRLEKNPPIDNPIKTI
jgi:hypothetical protein